MDNLSQLLLKNKSKILSLRNKEERMKVELRVIQQKYELLTEKKYLLNKNIELLQYDQKKYKKLKDTASKDKENRDSACYMLPFFFIKIPIIKILFILLFIVNIIDDFYKEGSEDIDKKIKSITSGLTAKKLEVDKTKKEIEKLSNNIKRLQKSLAENKFKQKVYYLSSYYILKLDKNPEPEKKLKKQLTIN